MSPYNVYWILVIRTVSFLILHGVTDPGRMPLLFASPISMHTTSREEKIGISILMPILFCVFQFSYSERKILENVTFDHVNNK